MQLDGDSKIAFHSKGATLGKRRTATLVRSDIAIGFKEKNKSTLDLDAAVF